MKVQRQLLVLALSIVAFTIRHHVQAELNQQGFISLDCGLPPNESPYTDPITGLTFLSDADLIQSGKRGEVGDDGTYTYKQYKDLRYFPDGIRSCYSLTVTKGINYLIRAGFSYGNYDGLNTFPRFDIHVGPNLWTPVDLSSSRIDYEIIYMSKSNLLEICLVKTGPTIPMISTLELRPLRNESYTTQPGPLNLIDRNHYKSNYNGFIRYPDDVLDRKWKQALLSSTIDVNTTLPLLSFSPFEVPEIISQAGISARNVSQPLLFLVIPQSSISDKIILYLHFTEVQTLSANDIREFNILWWDNSIIHAAYSPTKLQPDTKFNVSPVRCSKILFCFFTFESTQRSTLPPIVNAIETFTVLEFPYVETDSKDVIVIKNIQATFGLKTISWQGDPCVPEFLKWEDLKCSYKSTPPRIISLDLSSRGLSGSIPPSLQNLTELQKLDLSNNSFTGGLPEFLAGMKSLSIINLDWNNLTGPIPQAFRDREKSGLKLTVRGNPGLCDDGSCKNNNQQNNQKNDQKNNQKYILPIVASIAAVVIIILVLALIFVLKKKRLIQASRELPTSKPSIFTQTKRFTHSEVVALTSNFERVIGEGGFGVVYHGLLNDTQPVAVKVLSHSSIQGYKEFKAEVELLLRVHHVNLVSLVGYCDENDHLALIYEYAPNGDLRQHLSGERGGSSLKWSSRLKIVVETAQGLEYLHTGCKPPLVHRDVKTTNILLDEIFQAKLADFGLSRSFPIGGESHVATTAIAGTPGYLDPEYYRTNRLTEKSDVYSFGIVLLEMITSQPVIWKARERPHIAAWVRYMLTKGDIENVVDPRLNKEYDPNSMWKAIEIAIACVNPSSTDRPNMSEVINVLKECLASNNSRQGGSHDRSSKNSGGLSTSFSAQVTPSAR